MIDRGDARDTRDAIEIPDRQVEIPAPALHHQQIGIGLLDHLLHAGTKAVQHPEEDERDRYLDRGEPGAPGLAPQAMPDQREVFHRITLRRWQ